MAARDADSNVGTSGDSDAISARSQEVTALVELQRTLYESKNPTRRWLHTSRFEEIAGKLRRAASTGTDGGRTGRALEIGPGAGPYLPLMCDLFEAVTAGDIEPQYLQHVEESLADRSNLELVVDDIASSQLPAASFDVILCTEVIEHTPDPTSVVGGIARLLAPGGLVIISTPQAWSTVELVGRIAFKPPFLQLGRLLYREPVLPTGHISLLTRATLAGMLRDAGLTITESSVAGFYIPGIAELGGTRGLRLEQRLERALAESRFSGALWTQHWTATKP